MSVDGSVLVVQLVILAGIAAWGWRFGGRAGAYAVVFAPLFFNRLAVETNDLNLRVEYAVCAAAVLLHLPFGRRALGSPTFLTVAVLLTLFGFSSILFAPAPLYCLRKLAIPSLYAATAGLILARARSRDGVEGLFDCFMTVGNAVLGVSLAAYALYYLGLNVGFVKAKEQYWLTGPVLIANLFGSTAGALGVIHLCRLLLKERPSAGDYLWFVVACLCVFLSYTRGAWLAFSGFIVLLAVLSILRHGGIRKPHWVLAGVGVGLALLIPPLAGRLGFEEKFATLLDLERGSGHWRMAILEEGLIEFRSAPWFGKGFQTYLYVTGGDRDPGQPQQVILIFELLQYGGLAALSVFAGLILWLHFQLLRVVRRAPGTHALPLVARMLALDFLLLAYQVTSGIFLGFFWFLLMFLGFGIEAALRELSATGPEPRETPERPVEVEEGV